MALDAYDIIVIIILVALFYLISLLLQDHVRPPVTLRVWSFVF